MTSVQNFLAWLKERSKKSKMADSKDGKRAHALRPSVCRASLKLPPIPRQVVVASPVSRVMTDSPAHVYEEIPECDLDPAFDSPDMHHVDIENLDFAQAKEFGAYLVVPLKDKLRTLDSDQEEVIVDSELKRELEKERDICDCASDATSGYVSQGASSIYPSPSDTSSSLDSPTGSQSFSPDKLGNSFILEDSHGNTCTNENGETDSELQEFVNASFQRLRLTDIRRSHRGMRVVRFALDTPKSVNGSSGDRRSICSSQGSHMTGSDGSNDTCNEYDLQASDLSQSDSPKHSTPRAESDTSSSLYAFSISDREPAWSRDVTDPRDCTRHHESDSSNDTFSEYDIQSDVSSTAHDDYQYHLTKVRHNLQLKEEVMRMIKESESEYETTSGNESHLNMSNNNMADSISLTTVSSLSDLSLLDIDVASFIGSASSSPKPCQCGGQRGNGSKKSSSGKDCSCGHESIAGDSKHVKKDHKKSSKKKSSRKHKPMEYYLPEFGLESQEVQGDPLPARSNPLDDSDKLSCRATNFKPPAPAKMVAPTAVPPPSGRPGNGPSVAASRSRLNHVATGRQQNNRLLTDLMKMNHDRLLVLF